MEYEPGLLFVRILNPVPRMSWLACVWKTVIRLPMFPVTVLRLRKFPVCMSAIGKPPMHVFKLAAFLASFITTLIPRFLVHSYEQLIYRKD